MASPKSPVAIIVFFILILTILTSTNIAIGAAQVSRTVSSSGVISPNPSPNLAAIPSFWSASPLSTAWVINSGDQATRQSIVYPYTKNGQTTIELLPNPTFIPLATSCGVIYELDGQKTPIKTGDP